MAVVAKAMVPHVSSSETEAAGKPSTLTGCKLSSSPQVGDALPRTTRPASPTVKLQYGHFDFQAFALTKGEMRCCCNVADWGWQGESAVLDYDVRRRSSRASIENLC
ncbi:hypothetical protein NDA11_002112 [Ustilago hordei]|nr:hypothetical protein NDA10_007990 [Ustilago hordei]KAJ1587294.1 hypothetical protein NDA15_004160 [Ustilago hordei]KAJ1590262.1 hypothetical protein NDA12_005618 [Ustilago hordei]KAJ1594209.1 hypothetical protein NDA11_002112 [Ustilago hordei]KAJ1602642.1 hypothetical protein NDA14_007567 [Ustilago hordei]